MDLSQLLFDDHFSIKTIISKTNNVNTNLNDIHHCLLQYQQELNQTSLELFNNGYDRFYRLSHNIACLADPIQQLILPIQDFRDQLKELNKNHDSYLNEINNNLKSFQETSKNKEIARKLTITIKRRDRIDKQIKNIDLSVKHVKDIENKVKCDLLERLNIELYYLINEVQALQPTHDELILIKRSLEDQLIERQSQFDKWFESNFLEAIESGDKSVINFILKTYQQKNAHYKLDIVWCDEVVKPYLNLTLTEEQLSQQLTQTYKHLHEFLKRQQSLIEAEFVVTSYWREVVESLDKLDKFYSLNQLDTFQKRFNETRKFLNNQYEYTFCESSKTEGAMKEFKENTHRILSKFNLKGYYHHRICQVASSVESSLAKNPLCEITVTDNSNSRANLNSEDLVLTKFRLKICMHIYALIAKCWSPEIYIDSLELQFSQLACRNINRFADWLSKLSLKDFPIIGPTAGESNKQTNFLAKQDAIMRLLIEDCDRLTSSVGDLVSKFTHENQNLMVIRNELLSESFETLNNGLDNVRSLRKLIER